MVNEAALKEAFSKIKDEFSNIKDEIQRLNKIVNEITNIANHTEEYKKPVHHEKISEKDIERPKTEKKMKETIIKQHDISTNSTEVNVNVDEIIDADSYY